MGGEKEIGTTKTDTSCLAGTTGAAKLLAAGGSAIVFPKAPQFNIEVAALHFFHCLCKPKLRRQKTRNYKKGGFSVH